MTELPWYILGAGSIGSLFACRFQQADLCIKLLLPQASTTDRTLTENGSSNRLYFNVSAYSDQTPIQQLLLTTKAHQSLSAIKPIQHRLTKDTVIVVMQNGMGVIEQLQPLLPQCTFLAATTTEGVNRTSPQHIIYAGRGETWLGALDKTSQQTAFSIYEQWSNSSLILHHDTRIIERLWLKLAINCAINPLTVIYDCRNGALLENNEALDTMKAVCDEVCAVMMHYSVEPPADLFNTAKQIAKKTGQNISSMLQDTRNKKPTEIDFINGYIVRKASQPNIPTPINAQLLNTITTLT